MGVYQWRDKKKPSGGKRRWYYKVKRKYALGRPFIPAVMESHEDRVTVRVRGGNVKVRARKVAFAIVSDPEKGTSVKARILRVLETPANREYARRNIIVKGTIIETSEGRAIVTSRPGQDGIVNAILLKE
ncbi:MAG: 30S ribosomal protein S8e [Desulfurococcales archaeon]|nr:30S ribosomal protein S8e [Desulfurococcales archaeon]MEB3780336.1 30S ribosomal protein S8e [Desulfurococcales archaeon]